MDEPPSYNLLNILSDQNLLYFVVTAVLLFVSAWASAVEAAFFSLANDVVDRFRNSNDENEKRVARILEEPRLLLNTLTTCKYLALLATAILTVSLVSAAEAEGNALRSVAPTVLFLIIAFGLAGVIVAKIFGYSYNVSLSRSNVGISLKLVSWLKPLLNPLLKSSVRVEKKLDLKTEQTSVEQLTHALQLATIENKLVEGEKEIMAGIIHFGTLKVKQVMRPRSEISYTDIGLDFFQLMEFIKTSGYSRVPVCRSSLDNVVGFLYIKDLLPFLAEARNFAWQKLLRPSYVVQDTRKIDLLLKDFQEKRVHMALAVNAQGHTVGLITLEDIIEVIIGDINDEFDEPGVRFHKIDERTYLFDAKTSLYDFGKILNIDPDFFKPLKGINESLSAMLYEVNEKLPAVGDRIALKPYTFVIESVDQKRIKKIRVEIDEG